MVNMVFLTGNLGKDAQVSTLENGKTVARLNVATKESYKDAQGNWVDQVEWHTVEVWSNKNANNAKKGDMIQIAGGKNKTDEWTDKEGVKRYTTKVVARGAQFQMLTFKKNESNQGSGSPFPPVQDAGGMNDLL